MTELMSLGMELQRAIWRLRDGLQDLANRGRLDLGDDQFLERTLREMTELAQRVKLAGNH